jgi:hypothetical protein
MKKQTAKGKQQKANYPYWPVNGPSGSGFLSFVFWCLLFSWGSFCTLAKDSDAVRMRIHSLQATLGNSEIAVILVDEKQNRFLPISVGGDQALSIQLGREGLPIKRPLAHDLIANILKTLNARVERVTITNLKEGVYYAEIALVQNGRTHRIDARPSDAIALSLRVNAPIYAMPHLLQNMAELRAQPEVPDHADAARWGMMVQSLTKSLAEFFGRSEGVLVADVMEKSPAAQSGIRVGDILVRIDNDTLRNVDDFLNALAAKREAKSVKMEVMRGDQKLTFTLKKGE